MWETLWHKNGCDSGTVWRQVEKGGLRLTSRFVTQSSWLAVPFTSRETTGDEGGLGGKRMRSGLNMSTRQISHLCGDVHWADAFEGKRWERSEARLIVKAAERNVSEGYMLWEKKSSEDRALRSIDMEGMGRRGIHEGESESRSVTSSSLWPLGLHSPWNSSGQNTGVGGFSLLQGIFIQRYRRNVSQWQEIDFRKEMMIRVSNIAGKSGKEKTDKAIGLGNMVVGKRDEGSVNELADSGSQNSVACWALGQQTSKPCRNSGWAWEKDDRYSLRIAVCSPSSLRPTEELP